MRTTMLYFTCMIIFFQTLACSPDATPVTSAPAQIITDLPDNGDITPTHLYWVVGNHLFRGLCVDPAHILPTSCGDQRQSMSYTTFKTELDGGLSATIRALTEETAEIQAAIRMIERQIVATTQAIADLERQSGDLSAEIARLREALHRFDRYIRDYRDQLALIEASLRRLADADLAAQRLDMLRELAECQQKIADISRQVDTIVDEMDRVSTAAGRLQTELVSLTNRSTNLRYDLAIISTRLQAARDDFSVYEDTLEMLNDGVAYRVLADNVRFQKVRQFVRRFERIFAAHPM